MKIKESKRNKNENENIKKFLKRFFFCEKINKIMSGKEYKTNLKELSKNIKNCKSYSVTKPPDRER